MGGIEALVYLSSTRVYQRCTETSEGAVLSVRPDIPSDLYNLSKLMGESLCLTSGIDRVAIARLSNVIGPNEGRRNTFLGALCREARGGQIVLQSAPNSAKDYIWIDDAVRSLVELTTGASEGIVNVASGQQITHVAWSDAIARTLGATVKVIPGAKPAGFSPIDVGRLNGLIGTERINPLSRVAEITLA
ncbi:MAG: NAD-dependent epimerase/dehydratase family protein [Hyphomicrobiales bacterium]|nr:NAD-dependent epimerase/dehydratase family protein [Hyphomicrobiales bacterium]